jgi:hypothetical protein
LPLALDELVEIEGRGNAALLSFDESSTQRIDPCVPRLFAMFTSALAYA